MRLIPEIESFQLCQVSERRDIADVIICESQQLQLCQVCEGREIADVILVEQQGMQLCRVFERRDIGDAINSGILYSSTLSGFASGRDIGDVMTNECQST